MSTRLHIVVPDELVERIDAQRGLVPRSRWIVALIENALIAAPLISPQAEQAQREVPAPPSPRTPPQLPDTVRTVGRTATSLRDTWRR